MENVLWLIPDTLDIFPSTVSSSSRCCRRELTALRLFHDWSPSALSSALDRVNDLGTISADHSRKSEAKNSDENEFFVLKSKWNSPYDIFRFSSCRRTCDSDRQQSDVFHSQAGKNLRALNFHFLIRNLGGIFLTFDFISGEVCASCMHCWREFLSPFSAVAAWSALEL